MLPFLGDAPEGAEIHEQGFGWSNPKNNGNAADTVTSGLEGAWTSTPRSLESTHIFTYC